MPLVPNIGVSRILFRINKQNFHINSSNALSLVTILRLNSQFFYNIPFPVVSIALGIGAGVMKTDTSVTETTEIHQIQTIMIWYSCFQGSPYWPPLLGIIEFHIVSFDISFKLDLQTKVEFQ